MTAWVRARVRGRTSDAGVTIVELAVVMLVSSIVLAALGVTFASSLRASRSATSRTSSTAEARLAVDVMAQRLRVATRNVSGQPIVTEATSGAVTFWASLTPTGTTPGATVPAPSSVRYRVDPVQQCLLETVTPAGGAARSRCLAFGTGTLTLSYYQVAKRPTNYAPSPSAAASTALTLISGALSTADAALVGAVGLSLSWRAPGAPAGSKPLTLSTRVLLVNELNEEQS